MTITQLKDMVCTIKIWEEMGLGDEQIDNAILSLGYNEAQLDEINDAYCECHSIYA